MSKTNILFIFGLIALFLIVGCTNKENPNNISNISHPNNNSPPIVYTPTNNTTQTTINTNENISNQTPSTQPIIQPLKNNDLKINITTGVLHPYGSENATVKMVNFEYLPLTPFRDNAHFQKIKTEFIDTGKLALYHRDATINSYQKPESAIALRCLFDQNIYWISYPNLNADALSSRTSIGIYVDNLVFNLVYPPENYQTSYDREQAPETKTYLSLSEREKLDLLNSTKSISIDPDALNKCVQENTHKQDVKTDIDEFNHLSVNGHSVIQGLPTSFLVFPKDKADRSSLNSTVQYLNQFTSYVSGPYENGDNYVVMLTGIIRYSDLKKIMGVLCFDSNCNSSNLKPNLEEPGEINTSCFIDKDCEAWQTCGGSKCILQRGACEVDAQCDFSCDKTTHYCMSGN